MAKKFKIPGLSFSWKRALGISQLQSKISRQIGAPLSRSGRQRKIGAATGCAVMIVPFAASVGGIIYLISNFA